MATDLAYIERAAAHQVRRGAGRYGGSRALGEGRAGAFTAFLMLFSIGCGAMHAQAAELDAIEDVVMVERKQALMREIEQDAYETRHYTGQSTLSESVLSAMRAVPRDAFVSEGSKLFAWENRPLGIGFGQTISQPFIVALMTDLLNLESGDRVLEVGTGSGYQAAVLSELVTHVYTIEIVPELAASAAALLAKLEYANVSVRSGDGWHGWPEAAPFDAIIVTAVAEDVPPRLLEQLAPGGRIVLPLGPEHGGHMLSVITGTAEAYERVDVLPVRFVPLTRLEE